MPVEVEQLLITERAVLVLPAQVAVLLADGEERGDGQVRHAEAGQHLADDVPAGFRELMASFMYMWKTVPPV